MTRIAARPGEQILAEGVQAHHVFTLTRGTVRIMRTTRFGRRFSVAVAPPGYTFDLTAALTGTSTDASVVADSPCDLICKPLGAFLDDVATQPIDLATWLGHMQSRLITLDRYRGPERLEQRLATLIIDRTLRVGSMACDLGMSRGALADLLHFHAESLSRAFGLLSESGGIVTDGGCVTVQDTVPLYHIACGPDAPAPNFSASPVWGMPVLRANDTVQAEEVTVGPEMKGFRP